nr:hypothetical protein [Tanacetum cinerariifolium]
TTKEKVDTTQALDASLVNTESSRTESKEQDTSSRSGNDAHDDDAYIRPIYDEEPMAEVQTTAEIDVFAIGQQYTEQLEFNNEEEPRCDSQVDVHNDLSKPVTTQYFPKEREVASAKPHHMIASSNSRISSKNMTRFYSNDMVHNHYLEEAKKRTQEHSRNSAPSLMHSARSQSTANGSKPMPRRNTQTSRIWLATKNSFVTTKTVPIAEHPRNSRNDSCFKAGSRCCSSSKQDSYIMTSVEITIPPSHNNAKENNDKKETSVANNTSGLVPQRQKASDYDNPDPVPQRQDVYSSADADVPSQQELDIYLVRCTMNFSMQVLILQRIISLHQHHQLIQMCMLRKTTMIKQKKENKYKMMNLPILSGHRQKKKLSFPHTTL